MRPTNYFKARAPGVEQTFAFDNWDRRSVRSAFWRAVEFATRTRGCLSVFAAVPLAGPWSALPVIVPEALAQVWRQPEPRLALFGEGGCW
jgi:hypothetical protein